MKLKTCASMLAAVLTCSAIAQAQEAPELLELREIYKQFNPGLSWEWLDSQLPAHQDAVKRWEQIAASPDPAITGAKELQGAKGALDKFAATVDREVAAAPLAIERWAAKAKAIAVQAHAAKSLDPFRSRNVENVIDPLTWSAQRLALLRLVRGEESPEFQTAAKALDEARQHVAGLEGELLAEKAASTKPPAEAYRAPDKEKLRAQIKAHWNKAHPQDKVLRVYLVGRDWYRQQQSRYIRGDFGGKWVTYDGSFLEVEVVTQKDGKLAEVWSGKIHKDHQQRGQIDFSEVGRLQRPVAVLLVANVK